jgi:hypothetical protein
MAEIKDVYSLEFNSGQFSAEIDSAIAKVEELNEAMSSGADVSEELAAAQEELVSVLSTEAKGVEQLNQKRNVLVNTQKNLNKETKAGAAVTKELTATNGKLAVETGKAAGQQKSFIGQLIGGARAINSVKRAAGLLTGAFRLLGALNPLGLALMVLPTVIGWFQKLTGTTDTAAAALEKLDDKTLGYAERLNIAQSELDKLEQVEKKRGYLTENEKKQREELTKKYEETANEIVKIEQDRVRIMEDLERSLADTKVKLLGNTIAGANAAYNVEVNNIKKQASQTFNDLLKIEADLRKKLKEAQDSYNKTSSSADNKRVNDLQDSLDEVSKQLSMNVQDQNDKILLAQVELNQKIKAIKEAEKREEERKKKEQLDFEKMLDDEYEADQKRRLEDQLDGIEKFLEEQNKLYEDALKERKRQEELYAAEVSMKKYDDELNQLAANLKIASDYRQNNRETELAMDILSLEQERNQQLLYANKTISDEKKRKEQLENINKDYDKRRAQIERIANQEILRIRIEFLKRLRDETAAADPLAISELNKQIKDLELKLQELGKSTEEGLNPKGIGLSIKELVQATAEAVQIASDAVFQVLNAQVQSYISSLDKAADKSRETLNDIRQNSENFNARQLELEKERLEKLEAERARAVEREKTLAQVQIAINAAVTIAKAAAEGGGVASAFTIAAALASLIAGFASARAAAGNAFYHGVEYLERGNNPKGRDTIPARLHEGERVITAHDNANYWDVLTAVHNRKIPADILNGFALGYQRNGLKGAFDAFSDRISLSSELGRNGVFVNVGTDNSGLENRLERIEAALTELPKFMPRTTVTANANGIFKIVEQRLNRANFSRNRAK